MWIEALGALDTRVRGDEEVLGMSVEEDACDACNMWVSPPLSGGRRRRGTDNRFAANGR